MMCERTEHHTKEEVFVEMRVRGFQRIYGGIRTVYVCPVCKNVEYGEIEVEGAVEI